MPLYEAFVNAVQALGVPTATGRFGAMMQVELVNDGPVTLILDRPRSRFRQALLALALGPCIIRPAARRQPGLR